MLPEHALSRQADVEGSLQVLQKGQVFQHAVIGLHRLAKAQSRVQQDVLNALLAEFVQMAVKIRL